MTMFGLPTDMSNLIVQGMLSQYINTLEEKLKVKFLSELMCYLYTILVHILSTIRYNINRNIPLSVVIAFIFVFKVLDDCRGASIRMNTRFTNYYSCNVLVYHT